MEAPTRRAAVTRNRSPLFWMREFTGHWRRGGFSQVEGWRKDIPKGAQPGPQKELVPASLTRQWRPGWSSTHTHSHSSPSLLCVVSLVFRTALSKHPHVPITSWAISTAVPVSSSNSYVGTHPQGSAIMRRDFEETLRLWGFGSHIGALCLDKGGTREHARLFCQVWNCQRGKVKRITEYMWHESKRRPIVRKDDRRGTGGWKREGKRSMSTKCMWKCHNQIYDFVW